MQKLFTKLKDLLGKENFLTDPASLAGYSFMPDYGEPSGQPTPLAIARPGNLAALAETMKLCSGADLPLRIRGGGTWPGMAPAKSSVVILTTGLSRILEIDPDNRSAIVQGGVSCRRLNDEAASAGLFLPPVKRAPSLRTIGGAIAENAPGPYSLKYGNPGSYVRKMEICTSEGKRLEFFAQNNSPGNLKSGLPLAPLFAGSLGLLGVIARAEVSLVPAQGPSFGLVAGFANPAAAVYASSAIIAKGITPAAMEMLDQHAAALSGWSETLAKDMLFLEFDGSSAKGDMERARSILAANGAETINALREDSGEIDALWNQITGILPAIRGKMGPFFLETANCPPASAPAFMEHMQNITAKAGIQCCFLGSPGIARFLMLLFSTDKKTVEDISREIFTLELTLNNLLQSEEDLDLTRSQCREKDHGHKEISGKLRDIFDPKGLLAH